MGKVGKTMWVLISCFFRTAAVPCNTVNPYTHLISISISIASLSFFSSTGSGIFVSPSGLLVRTGSVGVSFIIWLACGVLSLLGKLPSLEHSNPDEESNNPPKRAPRATDPLNDAKWPSPKIRPCTHHNLLHGWQGAKLSRNRTPPNVVHYALGEKTASQDIEIDILKYDQSLSSNSGCIT